MRLDNYNASFEAYEPFEPLAREENPSSSHSGAETATPEQPVIDEQPSPLLSEMARNPPPVTLAPMPPAPPVELRRLPILEERRAQLLRERQERFEFDSESDGGLPRDPAPAQGEAPIVEVASPTPAPVNDAPAPIPVAAPAPAPVAESAVVAPPSVQAPPPPAPGVTPPAAPANAVSIPLPLGPVVSPDWLNQREGALKTLRADFEGAREAARNTPPADVATAGAGWVPAMAHGQGEMPNGAVWVPDAAATAAAAIPAWSWMAREGVGNTPADTGQWLVFNDGAYEQDYRGRLDAQAAHGASAPLATLAQLYGTPGQNVLASHPELWTLATQDHELNAGAPPLPGIAMGDALMLGQLDLYLADAFVTQLRTQLGGTPAAPTGPLAQRQQQLYGAERCAQLTQLSQAMAAVRREHAAALQEARNSGGVGWVDVPMQLGVDQETGQPIGIYATVGEGEIQRDANGMPVLATQRVFDEALFTNDWLAQGEQNGGLAQQAFAQFYGQAHGQIVLQQDQSESAGPPRWVSQASLDNAHVSLAPDGVYDTDLITLDLNHAPRLNDDRGVGFDPQLGWVTPRDNIHEHRGLFEQVMPIALVAFVGWATGGAALAANWGTIGAAAAAGAASSFAGGVINGNLSLKGVLIGAASGALTAGLTPKLTGVLQQTGMGAAAGVAARMTVQGGIQALLGGKFKDGAIAGFASGLAELTSDNIRANIKQAVEAGTMSASEALAARTFNTMLSSAIRAAGSPGDPAQAFAQDWLGALMQDNLPAPVAATPPAPAPAASTAEDDGGVQTFPVPAPPPSTAVPLPPDEVNPGEQPGMMTGDPTVTAAWDALSPEEQLARIDAARQQVEHEVRLQELADGTVGGDYEPVQVAGPGGARLVETIKPVINGGWDAALSMGLDPLGIATELSETRSAMAEMDRSVQRGRVEGLREQLRGAGMTQQPADAYYVSAGGGGIDYGATIENLQRAYNDFLQDKRMTETYGQNWREIRVGRSQMTMPELEKKVLDVQQQAANRAYEDGVKLAAKGELDLSKGWALAVGTYVDVQVRDSLDQFGKYEQLSSGIGSTLYSVNRQIRGNGWIGVPDLLLGKNLYSDTTIARKNGTTDQLQRWQGIRPGDVLIVRPDQLGGSYLVLRSSITPKPPKKP